MICIDCHFLQEVDGSPIMGEEIDQADENGNAADENMHRQQEVNSDFV